MLIRDARLTEGDGGCEFGAGGSPGSGGIARTAQKHARMLRHQEIGAVNFVVALPAQLRLVRFAQHHRPLLAHRARLLHFTLFSSSSSLSLCEILQPPLPFSSLNLCCVTLLPSFYQHSRFADFSGDFSPAKSSSPTPILGDETAPKKISAHSVTRYFSPLFTPFQLPT